jgi:hypothetical protein
MSGFTHNAGEFAQTAVSNPYFGKVSVLLKFEQNKDGKT